MIDTIGHFWPRANPAVSPFWGTCAVCFGSFKVTEDGRTSKHGFQRPGWGYTVGACFGQHKVAWEISPDVAIDFVKRVLRPALDDAKRLVNQFEDNQIVSIREPIAQTFKQRRNKEPVQYEEITPADPRWSRVWESHQRTAEANVRQIDSDFRFYEEKISRWQPGTLQPVDPSHPTSKGPKSDKVYKIVEKFRSIEVEIGQEPILMPPDGKGWGGYGEEDLKAYLKRCTVPTGRFTTKYGRRKVPYYDAVDATSGRKVGTGETREIAESMAQQKGYRPA